MDRYNSHYPLLTLTFIVFLTLKLCNVIAWSWWWVTAPLWGGAILLFLWFVGVVILAVIQEQKYEELKQKEYLRRVKEL